MRRSTLIATFATCFVVSCVGQSSNKNPLIDAVETGLTDQSVFFEDSVVRRFTIQERMAFHKVPSVSIAVVHDGKVEWAKAYGLADPATNRPANTNTLYQAASISKSVNAFAIMRLVQEGKLSADEDIRKYLRSWKFPDNEFSTKQKITLTSLLSHTAGLTTHGFPGYNRDSSLPSINQMLDGQRPTNSQAVKPLFKPDSAFKYSGGGTLITRKILDDNISPSYDSLLRKLVIEPVGMSNSSFLQPLPVGFGNFAVAHFRDMKPIPGGFHVYPELSPDGLWTTPTDIAKFIVSIQASLKNSGNGILNNTTAQKMLTPALSSSNSALGFFITKKQGETYFSHGGANAGFRGIYFGSFQSGDGVAIFVNSDNGQIMNEIVNSVATVYKWKDFVNQEKRKLVLVPQATMEKFAGTYESETPRMKIQIAKRGEHLEASAGNNFERVYFVAENRFFLMSSPNVYAEFQRTADGGVNGIKVYEGDKVVIDAKRL